MESFECVVNSIIYKSQDNDFRILSVEKISNENEYSGEPETLKIIGYFDKIGVGSQLRVNGKWEKSSYGIQFVVDSYSLEIPSTNEGKIKFLSSGYVEGIGKGLARLIVELFGDDTFNIIRNHPEKLSLIKGIGKHRAESIQKSFEQNISYTGTITFLLEHKISENLSKKLYKIYGDNCVNLIKENPYFLADEVKGVGFKKADEIAMSLDFDNNDERRCIAGLIYTLNELSEQGHIFAERDILVAKTKNILNTNVIDIKNALDKAINENKVIVENESIFIPSNFYAEVGISIYIKKLLKEHIRGLFEKEIKFNEISKKTGVQYEDIQKEAIKMALNSKIMVLTGGPGTGKSVTTGGIIAAFEKEDKKIRLTAPTGRAAKRMSEATGKEAITIHRLLEYNPEHNTFRKNGEDPLYGDVLIIDECSMIDNFLMFSLLKAVPLNMQLILVGDEDQLPSVGAGKVFKDIIDSEIIPFVRLKHIFRQAEGSKIITNAHKVNKGEFPDIKNEKGSDFYFLNAEEPEKAAQSISNLIKTRIPKAFGYNIYDIQVLAPKKTGNVGTIELNKLLQKEINTSENNILRYGDVSFKIGDKVMQILNNYEKNVFNGDIGTISLVDSNKEKMWVKFDYGRVVKYESYELNEITLAYATTIHKSQGSEYPVVIIPLLNDSSYMQNRNLLYTAITRAKKLCIIVGDTHSIGRSVNNANPQKRNTKLRERLCGLITP